MIDLTKIEKLKIFDKLLIWTSRQKVHVKDFEIPEEHGTMRFLPNGKIDLHRKNEKSNTYQPMGILDLAKFSLKLAKNPFYYLAPIIKMATVAKVVNFEEEEYFHLTVKIFPNKDGIPYISKKKGKEIEIPVEAIDALNNLECFSWEECKNKEFPGAYVYDKTSPIGVLQKTEQGKFMFVPLNEQTLAIKEELEKTWFNLDPPTWKEK